jgi:hypothetical protein
MVGMVRFLEARGGDRRNAGGAGMFGRWAKDIARPEVWRGGTVGEWCRGRHAERACYFGVG